MAEALTPDREELLARADGLGGRGEPRGAVQGAFALNVESPARPKQSPNRRKARRSIVSMAELALDRQYGTDIGDLLDQASSLRQFRLFNALLAVLQRPHARHLLSAEEWATKWGRTIRPADHPVVLLLPFGPLMFLFDVSQTEPGPQGVLLSENLENPYAMQFVQNADFAMSWLTMNSKHDGVRVSDARRGFSHAGCIRRSSSSASQPVTARDGSVVAEEVSVRFEVLLNETYTDTEQLATFAHELGHLYCGHLGSRLADWWPDRPDGKHRVREYEAETVARLVFRRIAPESSLPPHLEQYFSPGEPLPTEDWDVIVAAADRVVDMCQGVSPRPRK